MEVLSMSNVYEFKANNRDQVLMEADAIRNSVEDFNKRSGVYKIDRLVLCSNKLSSLFGGEDTVYVSFKKLGDSGYKDTGFVMQGASDLTVEIHKSQANKAMEDVADLLDDMKEKRIIAIKPLIELETSKFFKPNVGKEIYNSNAYINLTPLKISLERQTDYFVSERNIYAREKLKERVKSINDKSKKESGKKLI